MKEILKKIKNKKLILKNFQETNLILLFPLFLNTSSQKSWELLTAYFQIWPFFQWASSLITLIAIYWLSGYFYNKFLSQKGGWMDTKTRILMIGVDLILNFGLGIYYMNHRDTFIGTLMIQCPVFLSPFFWFLELVCFYIYYRYNFSSKK